MCAVCGCLSTKSPAPQEGTYKCVECEKAGKPEEVKVKKGDPMPSCTGCGGEKVHWIKT